MSPIPSIFQHAHTQKKGSLIPKVTFALCSSQEIHAANTFLAQKVLCYNNVLQMCRLELKINVVYFFILPCQEIAKIYAELS